MNDQLEANKSILREWHEIALDQRKPEEAAQEVLVARAKAARCFVLAGTYLTCLMLTSTTNAGGSGQVRSRGRGSLENVHLLVGP